NKGIIGTEHLIGISTDIAGHREFHSTRTIKTYGRRSGHGLHIDQVIGKDLMIYQLITARSIIGDPKGIIARIEQFKACRGSGNWSANHTAIGIADGQQLKGIAVPSDKFIGNGKGNHLRSATADGRILDKIYIKSDQGLNNNTVRIGTSIGVPYGIVYGLCNSGIKYGKACIGTESTALKTESVGCSARSKTDSDRYGRFIDRIVHNTLKGCGSSRSGQFQRFSNSDIKSIETSSR